LSKIESIKKELRYYKALATDRRTPKLAKILLALALGYLAMPFDLIPDFIPLIGHLDDLIIVPLLIWLSLCCIPQQLKQELRYKAAK